MTGKTVLITGGSGGIGLATAAGLAGLGARVGIVGRDPVRSETAAGQLRGAGAQVDVFVADMSSQREVRRLAEEVLAAYPRLDVLVNNVGGYWATRHTTVDGLEHTFAVNHLAPFLLTDLLLDRLREGAGARVVTVSSAAQSMVGIRKIVPPAAFGAGPGAAKTGGVPQVAPHPQAPTSPEASTWGEVMGFSCMAVLGTL